MIDYSVYDHHTYYVMFRQLNVVIHFYPELELDVHEYLFVFVNFPFCIAYCYKNVIWRSCHCRIHRKITPIASIWKLGHIEVLEIQCSTSSFDRRGGNNTEVMLWLHAWSGGLGQRAARCVVAGGLLMHIDGEIRHWNKSHISLIILILKKFHLCLYWTQPIISQINHLFNYYDL